MLQQTRVAQALPYYFTFLEHFPSVKKLAAADEEVILKLWQGLGYYSRARNMHATAKQIVDNYQGIFPNSYDGLKSLKGIGDYTAAAISSFAFDLPHAVVDGNVYRVLSRYFGIDTDISSLKAKKEFTELANSLLPKNKAALFNQAIMEFGAIQCTPKNPDCLNCVFAETCFAHRNNKVNELPVKLKKTKVQKRYLNYLVFSDSDNNTLVHKRDDSGIWANMYEFPCLETNQVAEISDLYDKDEKLNHHTIDLKKHQSVIHKLSHQHLYITFWKTFVSDKLIEGVHWNKVKLLPVPKVIANYIDENTEDN